MQEPGCGARVKGAGWFGFATCAWWVVNKSPRPPKQTGNGRKQGGKQTPTEVTPLFPWVSCVKPFFPRLNPSGSLFVSCFHT